MGDDFKTRCNFYGSREDKNVSNESAFSMYSGVW
jgi:hypothetical protein